MNYKYLCLFVVIGLFLSCKRGGGSSVSNVNSVQNKEELNCFSLEEKQEILSLIVGHVDFQTFLHPNVNGRIPIQIVHDGFFKDVIIRSNGTIVYLRDSSYLKFPEVHRIKTLIKDCDNNILSYSIYYPIEGAVLTGEILKNNNEVWKIVNANWGIKD